jgi:hypothetical protein
MSHVFQFLEAQRASLAKNPAVSQAKEFNQIDTDLIHQDALTRMTLVPGSGLVVTAIYEGRKTA